MSMQIAHLADAGTAARASDQITKPLLHNSVDKPFALVSQM